MGIISVILVIYYRNRSSQIKGEELNIITESLGSSIKKIALNFARFEFFVPTKVS